MQGVKVATKRKRLGSLGKPGHLLADLPTNLFAVGWLDFFLKTPQLAS